MGFWPFRKKVPAAELTPWQQFIQQWQASSTYNQLQALVQSSYTGMHRYDEAIWIYQANQLIACAVVVQGDRQQVYRLLEKLPVANSLYEASQFIYHKAPLREPTIIFANHLLCKVEANVSDTFYLWLEPSLYDAAQKPLRSSSVLFEYALLYHMLVPRFKEQEKSLSLHLNGVVEERNWRQPNDWGLMQGVVQGKSKAIEFSYQVAWPQKGDTGGTWASVVKRFSHHLARVWSDLGYSHVYKFPQENGSFTDVVVASAEIRYKEPYRLPIQLIIPKANLIDFVKACYDKVYKAFWPAYHHINLQLWHKNYEVLKNLSIYGGILPAQKQCSCVADFLLFLPIADQDKILQNFIATQYANEARALFMYNGSLDASDVRWVVSDLFAGNLLARLPKNVAANWTHLAPAKDYEQWHALNKEALLALARMLCDGKILLSSMAGRLLMTEVLNPYQMRSKSAFEEKYHSFYSEIWQRLAEPQRLQLISKIHNGQWIDLLVLKSDFFSEIQPYMSSNRRQLLSEEVLHFSRFDLEPYAEALHLLHKIAELKYEKGR